MTPQTEPNILNKEKRAKYVAWLNEAKTPEQRNARKQLAYAYLYNAPMTMLNKLSKEIK
jgi:hypothetical protein